MRKAIALTLALAVAGCATSNNLSVMGDYEKNDVQGVCAGMLGFAADYPQQIWPTASKDELTEKKAFYVDQSTVLFKALVNKYGKEDASARALSGYSSARSITYVLGGQELEKGLLSCVDAAQSASKTSENYNKFLNTLKESKEESKNNY